MSATVRTLLLFGTCAVAASCVFARPVPSRVGNPPSALGAASVLFPSGSGSTIHGWLAAGVPGRGSVLLLHGVGESRRVMLARAEFLHGAGFTVLAPDFQAHGESPGKYVTFGARESLDAQAALAFLRSCAPRERVGVIGVSMGGAAAVLDRGPVRADALVLESVYPTIRDAVTDRLRVWLGPLGGFGATLSPAVIRIVGARIGVSEQALRPIDHIGSVQAPLFILAGTTDRYTPLGETHALFAHARSPKMLWEVRGAGHEDLHAYAGAEYETRVGAFLTEHLRTPNTASTDAIGHATVAPAGACVSRPT